MEWNWQQSGWPNLTWDKHRFAKAEERFLVETAMCVGAIKHLGADDRDQLMIEMMSSEALTTSEIEGEFLDRDSVQSSIRRHLGLGTDNRPAGPAEQGIAEMMVSLYRSFDEPISNEMLFSWHRMVTNGRQDLKDIGRYRTHEDPMQIVSGPVHRPNIHFEAPPSPEVPEQMAGFIDWFTRTAPRGTDPLPALTRAGIAHIYFESIHPFEDENGRIGRAVAEKALAQTLGYPTLTALASTILAKRKSYYEALETNNKRIDITAWLVWFFATAIEAERRASALVDFLIDKTRLLDGLRGKLNDRQQKALLRMLREGPQGFRGGLTAGKYASITGGSPATTTRDLADLVEKGALTRAGERRHAHYELSIPVRPVASLPLNEQGDLVELDSH